MYFRTSLILLFLTIEALFSSHSEAKQFTISGRVVLKAFELKKNQNSFLLSANRRAKFKIFVKEKTWTQVKESIALSKVSFIRVESL